MNLLAAEEDIDIKSNSAWEDIVQTVKMIGMIAG